MNPLKQTMGCESISYVYRDTNNQNKGRTRFKMHHVNTSIGFSFRNIDDLSVNILHSIHVNTHWDPVFLDGVKLSLLCVCVLRQRDTFLHLRQVVIFLQQKTWWEGSKMAFVYNAHKENPASSSSIFWKTKKLCTCPNDVFQLHTWCMFTTVEIPSF